MGGTAGVQALTVSRRQNDSFSIGAGLGIFVVLGLVVALGAFWLTGADDAQGRWTGFLLTGSILLLLIFAANRVSYHLRRKEAQLFGSRYLEATSGVLLAGLAAAIALRYWPLLREAEVGAVDYYLFFAAPVFLILMASFFWGWFLGTGLIPEHGTAVFLFGLAALAFSALLVTRTGLVLFELFKLEPFFVLGAIGCFGFIQGRFLLGPTDALWRARISAKAIFAVMAGIVILLSLRTDAVLSIPGSYFHWSYYVGVVRTIRSGGTLLWDTPSQYGLGPVLFPALLPLDNAYYSFLIFQATVMALVAGGVVYFVWKTSKSFPQFIVISAIFVSLFFFADPALIGPHAYPSSSAVRFGPSLLLMMASFFLLSNRFVLRGWRVSAIYMLLSALSFWWSAESSVYTSAILLGFLFVAVTYRAQPVARRAFLLGLMSLTAILFVTLLISVIVFLRVRNLPDFSLFFLHATSYSAGFGGLPISFANPAWYLLVVVLLLGFAVSKSSKNLFISNTRAPAWILMGYLVALSTYWIGRAVPDNIVAMYPLLAVVLILAVQMLSESSEAPSLSYRSIREVSSLAVMLTVLSSVVLSVVVTQGTKPDVMSRVTFIGSETREPGIEMVSDDLVNTLIQLEESDQLLPRVYEGYWGILPSRSEGSEKLEPSDEVWIPSPLGLLEEPIAVSKREQIIERFFEASQREGLFIWDKQNSFSDRAMEWKSLVQKTHRCEQISDDEYFEVLKCAPY